MIRVLHVIGAMDRGGAETMIMNYYRFIDRSKIQFDFLVHEKRKCDYDDEIASLGGRVFRIPRFTGANVVSYEHACRVFFKEHSEFSIVHGHIGSCAFIYLREAKRAGCYAIAHSHAQNYEKGLQGLLFRMACVPTRRIADYFFACSKDAGEDRFGKKVAEGKRFAILRNGIDVRSYKFDVASRKEARNELGIEDDVPVFGHVGRLTEVKNQSFLLDVFDLVRRSLPEARLLMVGRGELEDRLKAEVCKRGLEQSVRFLGVRDDVPRLLHAMDVFVFPSIKEGMPVALIEAQASGLACLVSRGIPCTGVLLDSSKYLNISEGSEMWARECVSSYYESQSACREQGAAIVSVSGFDIAGNVEWLGNFYETR